MDSFAVAGASHECAERELDSHADAAHVGGVGGVGTAGRVVARLYDSLPTNTLLFCPPP
jgi:hypothetical protein